MILLQISKHSTIQNAIVCCSIKISLYWNADSTPGLLAQHQCLTSLMCFWLNGKFPLPQKALPKTTPKLDVATAFDFILNTSVSSTTWFNIKLLHLLHKQGTKSKAWWAYASRNPQRAIKGHMQYISKRKHIKRFIGSGIVMESNNGAPGKVTLLHLWTRCSSCHQRMRYHMMAITAA